MQKKVIALAVAGLMSGAAFAQSNVTISGRVDVGYQHGSATKLGAGVADTTSGIDNGIHDGSRLAFSGEEALGNGLKAIFMLEYRLSNDVSAGVGATGSRQQYVGLAGDMGTVTAGHVYMPSDDMGMFDSMDQTNFSPRLALLAENYLNTGAAGSQSSTMAASRLSNAVKYTSNSMGGFTFSGAYAFAPMNGDGTAYDANGDDDQERGLALGVTYSGGPLSGGLYYDRYSDVGNDGGDRSRILRLAGQYDFGAFALQATWERGRTDDSSTGTVNMGDNKSRVWSVGATMPAGNGLVRAQYARLRQSGDIADATAGSDDGRGWGIQYDYNLSKRSMLYAGYTRVSADNGTTVTNLQGLQSGAGGKSTLYGFGLLHKF